MPEQQDTLCFVGLSHWPVSEINLFPVQWKDRCPSSEYSDQMMEKVLVYKITSFDSCDKFVTIYGYYSFLLRNILSLKERKKQWLKEEEERRRNAPDPTAPAGHTLMPENERQETLNSLKECNVLSLCLHIYDISKVQCVCWILTYLNYLVVFSFPQLIVLWWPSSCHCLSSLTRWAFAHVGLILNAGSLKLKRPLKYSPGTKFM